MITCSDIDPGKAYGADSGHTIAKAGLDTQRVHDRGLLVQRFTAGASDGPMHAVPRITSRHLREDRERMLGVATLPRIFF